MSRKKFVVEDRGSWICRERCRIDSSVLRIPKIKVQLVQCCRCWLSGVGSDSSVGS
jgi:hypothetical protein